MRGAQWQVLCQRQSLPAGGFKATSRRHERQAPGPATQRQRQQPSGWGPSEAGGPHGQQSALPAPGDGASPQRRRRPQTHLRAERALLGLPAFGLRHRLLQGLQEQGGLPLPLRLQLLLLRLLGRLGQLLPGSSCQPVLQLLLCWRGNSADAAFRASVLLRPRGPRRRGPGRAPACSGSFERSTACNFRTGERTQHTEL